MLIYHSGRVFVNGPEILEFVNILFCSGELYLAPVISSKAHARLLKVDAAKALSMPGVVDFVSHLDVPGSNVIGPIQKDEEIFPSSTVRNNGRV